MTQERQESQGFYQMLWDCDHCDTKGLLAQSQRHCPECGAKQNPDKRYFPKEGEEQRVDGHKYAGSDRACPSCQAPQSALAHNCTHCGSPLDGAAEVRGVAAPVAPVVVKKRRWWIAVVVIIVIAAIIFGIWYRFIRKHEATVTVTAHRWERAIGIEKFDERQEQAWRNEMPSDARMSSCHTKQRSTKQVPDGEECHMVKQDKKDGTFEKVNKCTPKYRSEPVEDDWCSFTARRWKEVDSVRKSGTGLSPEWPTNVPRADVVEMRAGKRVEKLILDFGKQSCDVDDTVWRKHADGAKLKVDVRASSGDIVCSSL
jgi:hypothetical protein